MNTVLLVLIFALLAFILHLVYCCGKLDGVKSGSSVSGDIYIMEDVEDPSNPYVYIELEEAGIKDIFGKEYVRINAHVVDCR